MNIYTKCKNCGAYVPVEKSITHHFCSTECSRRYTICTMCGKYFLMHSGFKTHICSERCAVSYKITKRYVSEETPPGEPE